MHKGQFYYFGKARADALELFKEDWPSIVNGEQRPGEGYSVADVCNAFLEKKRRMVVAGKLTAGMHGEYINAAKLIATELGRSTLVESLKPLDFGKLHGAASEHFGVHALAKFITMTKSIFRFAYTSEMIEKEVRYGDEFEKPDRKEFREARNAKPKKMLEPAELRKLIASANTQMRAMILLGLNAGFGQTDCATLPRSAVDLDRGWITIPRPKTGIARACPLWPETVAAIREHRLTRPKPNDPADEGLEFITVQGLRWVRYVDRGPDRRGSSLDILVNAFTKLAKKVGVKVPGGFYVLRHIHRTIAARARDAGAADAIMGHGNEKMSERYIEEGPEAARLLAVTSTVHDCLYGQAKAELPAANTEEPVDEEPPTILKFRAG